MESLLLVTVLLMHLGLWWGSVLDCDGVGVGPVLALCWPPALPFPLSLLLEADIMPCNTPETSLLHRSELAEQLSQLTSPKPLLQPHLPPFSFTTLPSPPPPHAPPSFIAKIQPLLCLTSVTLRLPSAQNPA